MNKISYKQLMNEAFKLFSWEHIHIVEILKQQEVLNKIKKLEPTMVPAFLLDVDKVKIISQVVLVNKVEEVTISEYYNMEGLLLGNAVLYKGDIVIEVSN